MGSEDDTVIDVPAHQSIGWPLHDDSGVVTDSALEEQLELVRTKAVSQVAGVFGPASMTWRNNREAILFLAAGRALLLQLAHPWIAAAVAEHSTALTDPFVRFRRTFKVVFTMIFGTLDQAMAAARSLHRRHSLISGTLPEAAGPFAAGSPYYANNISALRWVSATLSDSAMVAHDLVLGPLCEADRAQFYTESLWFAGLFGIPSTLLPADYMGLNAYVGAMCDSDILTVSAAGRRIAAEIFAWRGSWFRIPGRYRVLTAGMLPERLRRDFGLNYADAEQRSSERALRLIRHAYRLLPTRLRYVGPYHEALQRLAGTPNPDLLTRFANRLWMGSPSLAD
jgi:uncharacterized protein (DUF2236 family)